MRRSTLLTAVVAGIAAAVFFAGIQTRARAHCEIPCGIYDDHARIDQMLEDATTIAKAVSRIDALAGQRDPQALNQAARWIAAKEEHATRVQHTIGQYFLTQRVKPAGRGTPGWDEYVTRLVRHHRVMVAAMKTKQSVDQQNVQDLREAIEAIAAYYPGAK
jgi:nickel superoxide dismutase